MVSLSLGNFDVAHFADGEIETPEEIDGGLFIIRQGVGLGVCALQSVLSRDVLNAF